MIALVGNAPSTTCWARAVDAAGQVVRINRCRGIASVHGTKTDQLVLVNCGGQMREWLARCSYREIPGFAPASRIVLPIHPATARPQSSGPPSPADSANYAEAARSRFVGEGKNVTIIPARIFEKARGIVNAANRDRCLFAPSTGFVSLLWLLETHPWALIQMFGFSFEGWGGHAWESEERFVQRLAMKNRVRIFL